MLGRSIILSPFLTYNVFGVMFEFGVRFFFFPLQKQHIRLPGFDP